MLKIRLQRTGKKNQPFFRIVVTEKKNPPRGGRSLEMLGFLNPRTKEKQIKAERVKYWLSVGAQPSDRVHNLLVKEGVIKADKKPVHAKPDKSDKSEKLVPEPESGESGTLPESESRTLEAEPEPNNQSSIINNEPKPLSPKSDLKAELNPDFNSEKQESVEEKK